MARNVVGALVCTALALPALAATTPVVEDALDEIMEVTTLDEVVVSGRLDSLSGLRMALVEAEDRFYERWNELNDDPRFDVQCRIEAPTGSNLKRRMCAPNLVDEKTRESALQFAGVTNGTTIYKSTYAIRLEAAAELKKRTLLMIENDPDLRRALLERARLEELLEARRKEKFSNGRWFAWD